MQKVREHLFAIEVEVDVHFVEFDQIRTWREMSRHFSEIKAIWLAFDSLFYFTIEHLILREKGEKVRNTPLKRFWVRGLVT